MVLTAVLPNVINVMTQKETYKEKTNTANPQKGLASQLSSLLWYFINLALLIFAIHLSYKRNDGFNFLSVLVAFCCSPCYILYAYAVPVYNAPSV